MLWVGLVTAINSTFLYLLYRKVNTLMAKELDLEDKVTALEALVLEIAALVAELKANGTQNVTQAELDALDSRLGSVITALTAVK